MRAARVRLEPGSHMHPKKIGWRGTAPHGRRGRRSVLKLRRDEMLPAVKPGIDGPLAGPD
jgi:hypothetical protein